ncbi:MAG: hypothetical protein ABGZ36_14900 [Actinomycetota bacterium]
MTEDASSLEQVPRDGLLPPPASDEVEWLRPNFGEMVGEDVLRAAVQWIADVQQVGQVAWPALFNGRLAVPPAAHVVDAMVRMHLHHGESPEWDAEWDVRPKAGTIIFKDRLPNCDVCGRQSSARYDAPMAAKRPAPWGHLCPWCYLRRSTRELGIGFGQFILLNAEVPGYVWDAAAVAVGGWAARGAPVTIPLDERDRPVTPQGLAWPYARPFVDPRGREVAFGEVLEGTFVDRAHGLFADLFFSDGEEKFGYLTKPHRKDNVVQALTFSDQAWTRLQDLAADLQSLEKVQKRADHWELVKTVVHHVARVITDGLRPRKALARLESSVHQLVGPTVWVAPLDGVRMDDPPVQLGDSFVIGRLGPELHKAINALADANGIRHELDFDSATDWAEDYESFLEDSSIFEDFYEEAWRPVVVVQVVDAVGTVAHHLGFQKAQSLAGAIWVWSRLVNPDRHATPPWVLGDPSHSRTDRDDHMHLADGDDEDDVRERGGVTIFTLSGAGSEYHPLSYVDFPRIDLTEGMDSAVVGVVARWSPTDLDRQSAAARVAAASRHVAMGVAQDDLYAEAVHLVSAFEALLVVSSDSIGSTLANRAARVLDDVQSQQTLTKLYDLRSDAAHWGLSTRALAESVDLIKVGWSYLPKVVSWVADRAAEDREMDAICSEIDALSGPEHLEDLPGSRREVEDE